MIKLLKDLRYLYIEAPQERARQKRDEIIKLLNEKDFEKAARLDAGFNR